MTEAPPQTIPQPFNPDKYVLFGSMQVTITQLNKVLASMLAANNGQGLAWVNPYTPVDAPSVGDIPQWTTGTPNAYRPKSISTIIGFGFQRVASVGSFTTPTIPTFGFTEDTQQYYVYSGGWKLIGTVEP